MSENDQALRSENRMLVKHVKKALRERAISEIKLARIAAKIAANERPVIQRRVVGFQRTMVPSHASLVLNAQPQMLCVPERLVLTTPGFQVDDLCIGRASQFLTACPIDGDAFLGDVNHVEKNSAPMLALDTCIVGQLVTLAVTNVTDESREIGASFVGMLLDFEDVDPSEEEIQKSVEEMLEKMGLSGKARTN